MFCMYTFLNLSYYLFNKSRQEYSNIETVFQDFFVFISTLSASRPLEEYNFAGNKTACCFYL